LGHSSHVTRVRFSKDDNWLVSTGGNDKTVLLWKTGDKFGGPQIKGKDDEHGDDDGEHVGGPKPKKKKADLKKEPAKKAPPKGEDDVF